MLTTLPCIKWFKLNLFTIIISRISLFANVIYSPADPHWRQCGSAGEYVILTKKATSVKIMLVNPNCAHFIWGVGWWTLFFVWPIYRAYWRCRMSCFLATVLFDKGYIWCVRCLESIHYSHKYHSADYINEASITFQWSNKSAIHLIWRFLNIFGFEFQ